MVNPEGVMVVGWVMSGVAVGAFCYWMGFRGGKYVTKLRVYEIIQRLSSHQKDTEDTKPNFSAGMRVALLSVAAEIHKL